MASVQLSAPGTLTSSTLVSTNRRASTFSGMQFRLEKRCLKGLTAKAATVVTPKYTTVRPLGDRVLVEIKTSEEKTSGGIFLPSTAQTKPQSGEVVAIGEGRAVGDKKVEISVPLSKSGGIQVYPDPNVWSQETGAEVVYSKYSGTEIEFNGVKHLILHEDDIVGIIETEDVKDLKPLSDRVLIKVAQAEEKTAGGLLLTEASKEKPSIGTIIAVGPGLLDNDGNRKALDIIPGSTVLYSKYAGSEFKGDDGSDYIVLRFSDVMAILS